MLDRCAVIFFCLAALVAGIVPEALPAGRQVIQAEAYDRGGEGIAYHDTTAENTGNAGIRTDEGVDLWTVGDGIIKIGSVRPGEWVAYSVGFPVSGNYRLRFFLATPNDGAILDVSIDGKPIATLTATNTGTYRDFAPVEIETAIAAAGTKTVKIGFTGASVDLDRFDIEPRAGLASSGFEIQDHVTYQGTTDKDVKVSWDEQDADYYEVVLYSVEKGVDVPAGSGKTTKNQIIFKLPYGGHFVAKVRACLNPVGEAAPLCSAWTLSTDDDLAKVGDENRGWWLYGHVAPPGSIDITPNEE